MYIVHCTSAGAMVLRQQYMIYCFVLRQYSVQCTPEGAMVLYQQYMLYWFVLRQYGVQCTVYSVHQRVLWYSTSSI